MSLRPSIFIWAIFVVLISGQICYSQPLTDYETWSERLSSTNDNHNKAARELHDLLYPADSATSLGFYTELEKRNPNPNIYFKARVHCLKIFKKLDLGQHSGNAEIIVLTQQALSEAYESQDEHLIAYISFRCGILMLAISEMELAGAYLLKGQEMADLLGGQSAREQYSNYIVLGEALFHCREYRKSLYYTRRSIDLYDDTVSYAESFRARFHNTMGQNYLELEMPDSAMAYFDTSLHIARKTNNDVWKGINSGFMGQVLYTLGRFDEAKPLLQYAYNVNREHERDHAAKSLQWLARIDLMQGRTDSALVKCNEARVMLEVLGKTHYLQASRFLELVYFTLADVHRAMKNADSFYHYNRLYTALHDSLQRISLLSSSKVSQLRVDNENNLRAVQLLQREKRIEVIKRNFLIIAILLVSIIVFLYVKRWRLKQQHKEQLALQERKVAEAELQAAREQMKLFTENIIEKTNLIEKLKQKVENRELSYEQHQVIDEISHRTILTEAEWEHFKSLFEKVYPGFFTRMRERARDITLAELRMAALTRLNLTARQMASMLGISVDSVHKTRQRLRQRLHVPAEANLEQSVAEF
jgi:tetratricopeptide (TPR) repeat protein/DNA-binding CsgD family transcriptional regulator